MKPTTHWHLIIIIAVALVSQESINVECRAHFHKKQKNKGSSSGYPPPSPPQDPAPPSPVLPPPIPSDPSNPPGSSSSNCIFDVTSFGAVGDGSTDDTAAFRRAWQAACAVESGVVLAPSDYTFMITSTIFSGPCKRGLVFQVDGVLMAPNGPNCWPKTDSSKQWLVFYRLDEMTLTGSGTIEGNGEQWWELPCKPHRIYNKELVKNPSEEFCLGKKMKKESKKAIVKFKETLQDSSEEGGNEEAEGNIEEYEASNGQEDQASSGEAEAREESEEIKTEDKEQNEHKEKDSEEEDEHQEENKEESDEEERNEPIDQQRDSICGSTMHQPQESEESKDAQIADLHQRLKALSQSKKEEERNWIELLAEKDIAIRTLTSLNSEHQERDNAI